MKGPDDSTFTGEHRPYAIGAMDDRRHMEYHQARTAENAKFWARLGGKPSFKGLTVLEVGCGHGQLCVEIALSGARKVVGLDLNRELIDFANHHLQTDHPQLRDVVEFLAVELKDYDPEKRFDAIVSYSTFEHVIDLDGLMVEIKRRLVPGGRVYFGFGPLYDSPFGDHGLTMAVVPWGHLIFPERILLAKVNNNRIAKVSSIKELGLNRWSLRQYEHLFRNSGLTVSLLKTNVCERILPRIVSSFSRIPRFGELFTFNMYGILEKPSGE